MEIKLKEQNIKLKKDYLTNGEVNYILSEVFKLYDEPGDIDGYAFSPLTMITNFYALLFETCVDGYNSSVEDYNKYYNIGLHHELLRVVTNADEAYHLMMTISKDISSLENIMNKSMNKLVSLISEKIPDAKSLSKMASKLPKDWQKVVSEYNDIVGISKEDK